MDRAQVRDLADRDARWQARRAGDCSERPAARGLTCRQLTTRRTPVNLPKHLLPTTVVGSYPQPEWLVDRAMLSKSVPRTRMHERWRLPAEHLEEPQDDATIVAIRDMERAGIDVVTDGEIRRESYSNRFATPLEGIDADNPAMITAQTGQQTPVPRVVGKVTRSRQVELRDIEFLRNTTDRAAKITLPGPFTMSQQAKNEFYEDDEELAMAFAEAVNDEALDLEKAGADVIQLDEPWVRNNPDLARRYAVKAINRALQGITVPTVVHLCFGYAAVAPDCGMKYMPRAVAFGKLKAMCDAATIVRNEIG